MRIYNISDFGAVGDGNTINTVAIQNAIDECEKTGGGRVLITDGVYMTGSITLKSGVDLHIERTGTLLGSPNCADYPLKENLRHVKREKMPRCSNASLIFAEEGENISITGMGKIDCNGENFVIPVGDDSPLGCRFKRIDAPTPPRVVFFTGCKNLKFEDITITNQPSGWSYWIHDCDFVSFDRCKIFANVQYPNNDGIHINCSRNVIVSNCNIICGDDSIVVRANSSSLSENKPCENITVSNCNLTSYANGIRIGWLNDGVIKNCVFSNITMSDTNVGIGIVLPLFDETLADRGREETLVENLSFNNIIMDGMYANPIVIEISETEGTKCKYINDIYFSNIHAKGLEFPYLRGRTNKKIKNVVFSNCTFEKCGDEVYPNYEHHGYAYMQRLKNAELTRNCENVVFHNTIFSEK